MTSRKGAEFYRAPEVNGRVYDCRADIFSLGVVAFDLLLSYFSYANSVAYWAAYGKLQDEGNGHFTLKKYGQHLDHAKHKACRQMTNPNAGSRPALGECLALFIDGTQGEAGTQDDSSDDDDDADEVYSFHWAINAAEVPNPPAPLPENVKTAQNLGG